MSGGGDRRSSGAGSLVARRPLSPAPFFLCGVVFRGALPSAAADAGGGGCWGPPPAPASVSARGAGGGAGGVDGDGSRGSKLGAIAGYSRYFSRTLATGKSPGNRK